MKVRVDDQRCQGHGRCFLESPDVFDADDEGFAIVATEHLSYTAVEGVRRAVQSCPERAIELIE
jgi:ferredoxin